MSEIWKTVSDAASYALESAKAQVQEHPLLDASIAVGGTLVGALAFKGKLAAVRSCRRSLECVA